jgi:hypothetical protein
VIDGFISNIRSFPIFKICVFNEFLGASWFFYNPYSFTFIFFLEFSCKFLFLEEIKINCNFHIGVCFFLIKRIFCFMFF